MSGPRLLLVDDEAQIVRALSPALQAAGYEVTVATGGAAALTQLAAEPCDAIILDLGLPDMDGKEVIGRVREWSDAPIIVLSARDLESEKIAALDAGADDYVNKPVGVGELLARVRASLRGRERRFASQARFRTRDLTIDFAVRRVWLEDQEVHLTPREYDLLRTLARHAGRIVTHRQLIAAVWGARAQVDAQFVRVLVGQLRQKLEAEPSSPRLVRTEPGLGYRLAAEDEVA
ncbi:MAG: response regulator transcription factor [Phenylobacterium sp.]|uniref:response regulator n=1 Tax=Phenylobacterium sp. TaxID=1871053 RepID=UPI001A3A626F|nr:response regulator transcription factor [Phenylobacterium sp.]MBL8772376.1 response regulator transcription factor [Phenylobacterium sp.]